MTARKFINPDFESMTPRERGADVMRRLGAIYLEEAQRLDPWLTVKEAAELIHRDEETVRLWCKNEGLGIFDRSDGPRGRYRFRRSELIAWWRKRFPGGTLPAALRD